QALVPRPGAGGDGQVREAVPLRVGPAGRCAAGVWYRPRMSRSAIGGTWSAPRMTLAQWADLPEDEPGELVDGTLEEDEVPSPVHEIVVSALNRALGNWAVPQGGLVLGSGAKYAVRIPDRGRMPDLSAFLPGSRKPSRAALITLPPDIAVEIVSPTPRDGRRDRVEKLKEYAAF